MKKIVSKKEVPQTKEVPVKNQRGHRALEYTKERAEEEAEALLKWIKEEKGYYLGHFAEERGYHRKRFIQMCEVSEKFKESFDYAKMWQENRFIKNGLNRSWDCGFTRYVMARVCDPIWKQSWDREDDGADKTVNVVVHRFGEKKK